MYSTMAKGHSIILAVIAVLLFSSWSQPTNAGLFGRCVGRGEESKRLLAKTERLPPLSVSLAYTTKEGQSSEIECDAPAKIGRDIKVEVSAAVGYGGNSAPFTCTVMKKKFFSRKASKEDQVKSVTLINDPNTLHEVSFDLNNIYLKYPDDDVKFLSDNILKGVQFMSPDTGDLKFIVKEVHVDSKMPVMKAAPNNKGWTFAFLMNGGEWKVCKTKELIHPSVTLDVPTTKYGMCNEEGTGKKKAKNHIVDITVGGENRSDVKGIVACEPKGACMYHIPVDKEGKPGVFISYSDILLHKNLEAYYLI